MTAGSLGSDSSSGASGSTETTLPTDGVVTLSRHTHMISSGPQRACRTVVRTVPEQPAAVDCPMERLIISLATRKVSEAQKKPMVESFARQGDKAKAPASCLFRRVFRGQARPWPDRRFGIAPRTGPRSSHGAMQTVFVAWYNFAPGHEALGGKTPAMASGLADKVWKVEELPERAAAC